MEVTRDEAEDFIDPHIGLDENHPRKRRRVFVVDEFEDEFVGGERVSDLMDLMDIFQAVKDK